MNTEENLEPIVRFDGDFAFLSNFFPCEVVFQGIKFPTTEHAYQAGKVEHDGLKLTISKQPTAGKAKRFTKKHKIPIRKDWDEVKFGIMEDVLRLKFSQPIFQRLLLATGNRPIVEENTWNDTIWGVCHYTKQGDNHLGKLLMKIRDELRGDSLFTY